MSASVLRRDTHSAESTRGLMERPPSSGHLAYSNSPKILRQAAEANLVKEQASKLEQERDALDGKATSLQLQCDELQARAAKAEAERCDMEQELSVAKAEMHRLEETLLRADAAIQGHCEDKKALANRCKEAESLVHTMRLSVSAADEARSNLQEKFAVAQAERHMLDEQLTRTVEQLNAATQQKVQGDVKLGELRAENATLMTNISVAHAERRMLDERIAATEARAIADVTALRALLEASEARVARCEGHSDEARAFKAKAESELAQAQLALGTAQAETKLLQDLCLHQLKRIQDDMANLIKERDAMMRAQQIAAASQAPLPSGWSSHLDPLHGIPYYVNNQSGQTTWERPPPDPIPPQMPPRELSPRGSNKSKLEPILTPRTLALQDSAASFAQLAAQRALPPGWQEMYDKKSKKKYYVGDDGEVTWERPTGTKSELKTAAAEELKKMDEDGDGIITQDELNAWRASQSGPK